MTSRSGSKRSGQVTESGSGANLVAVTGPISGTMVSTAVNLFNVQQQQQNPPIEAQMNYVLTSINSDAWDSIKSLKKKLETPNANGLCEFTDEEVKKLIKHLEDIGDGVSSCKSLTAALIEIVRQLQTNNTDQRVLIADLQNKLTIMQEKIAIQAESIQKLEQTVGKLEKKLQSSQNQVALLKLRQLLRTIETTIYKHFVPQATNNKRDYKLRDLYERLSKDTEQNKKTKEQLERLLERIGFTKATSKSIQNLIEGYKMHEMAHSDLDEVFPTDNFETALKATIIEAEIVDVDDVEKIENVGVVYRKLKEELEKHASQYSEVIGFSK